MKSLKKTSYTLKRDHKFEGVRLLKGDKIMAYPHQIDRIKRIESTVDTEQTNEKTEKKDEIDFLAGNDSNEKQGDK